MPPQWALPCSSSRRQQTPLLPQATTLQHGTPAPPQSPEPTIQDLDEQLRAEAMRSLNPGLMDIAHLRQRRQDKSEVAYHQGLLHGCPQCHQSDCLTRKRSSHLAMPLILRLRCERCNLLIGSKRAG